MSLGRVVLGACCCGWYYGHAWTMRRSGAAAPPKNHNNMSRWATRNRQNDNDQPPPTTTTTRRKTSKTNLDLTQFDFTSLQGWDFFHSHLVPPKAECAKDASNKDASSSSSFDWHASLSHDTLLQQVEQHLAPNNNNNKKILMAGCGVSSLPLHLWQEWQPQVLTLLDYSQPSLDFQQDVFAHHCPSAKISLVCGDVTNGTFGMSEAKHRETYNIIFDKGLMDALMCASEGWDVSVQQMFRGAATHALKRPHGYYVLISYPLTSSTQLFLSELGQEYGFQWNFHLHSQGRTTMSIAETTNTMPMT